MKDEIKLARTVFSVTQKCTLRCKLCLAFVPYYKEQRNLEYDEAALVFKKYFEVVDYVDVFTITGGEPLLNPELYRIIDHLYNYTNQITKSIDFVTNGTLNIPENLLDLFAEHATHTRIILSDYGDLSTKIESIIKKLEEKGIDYRISNFHGDNLYFDGWIDFSDHEKKIFTIEERDAHGEKCIHKTGKYYIINDGELHNCSRSYWRMRNGIIHKKEGEYIPLLDNTPIEKKKENLRHMFALKSVTSCAHCVGFRNDVQRQYPAEQL